MQFFILCCVFLTETEDETVDSDLLQDVFTEETEWVPHSSLQTEPSLPSTPVRLQCTECLQKMNINTNLI